jgi:hypothetical protein
MNGYSPIDITLNSESPTSLGASVSNQVVSKEKGLTAGGSRNLVVVITVDSESGSTTAKLQEGIGGVWSDISGKSVTLAVGKNIIRINDVTDTALLPLLPNIRVLASTGSGEAVVISKVELLQEL